MRLTIKPSKKIISATLFLQMIGLIFSFSCPRPSFAAETIIETQHLWFGKIVITKNDAVYTLALDPNNGVIADNAFVILQAGNPGIFALNGFPANYQITASIQPAPSQTTFQSGSATATEFDIFPSLETETFNTDANGSYELRVFGRLKTSGTGLAYLDGTYFRNYQIVFNYN
ncbi:hypothetical protein [Hydrogenovibrio kuenenii]|uniref:hypothetical protein n=1 Tax=Hydrogenovibrio kuenenii TaxID=63658 RepID=UPI0004647CC8|nr:hypothetical protein [Hydrogenovibrio kuenenii]